MNRNTTDQNLGPSVSSLGFVAGPSNSPGDVLKTPAGTLVSIREIRLEIINTIEGWRKKTTTAQALADVLRSSIAEYEPLLNATEGSDDVRHSLLQDLNNALRDVQRAVNSEVRPRKRHAVKGAVIKLLGGEHPDIFPSCVTRAVQAFQALELNPATANSTAPTSTSQQTSASTTGGTAFPTSQTSESGPPKTALDTVEKILQVTSGLGDVIPAPAGSIVKVVGAVGLSIIKMLNDVISNNEEAQSLATYVDDLVITIAQFLQNNGRQISADTVIKLRGFEVELKSVHEQLKSFKMQGGFRKGVSHARNKEVLAGCDAQIRRSFTQLQVHLSLDAVRLLTSLGDTDTRRECDRLLDRLGDADTGATDKANDPADLMCLEGTRVDLLDEVDNWASDTSSKRVLWINGVAGCGKSVVAATVANRWEGQSATAIFHFARSNQSRNKRVICSIARQLSRSLVRWTDGSPEHLVLDRVQANPDIAQAHLSTQFKELLADPLTKLMPGSPPVLIIIDALDEWDNHDGASKLVNLIHQQDSVLHPSIKFILTSRKESHLTRAFDSPLVDSLVKAMALDTSPQDAIDRDIHMYLKNRFECICSASRELSATSWPGQDAIENLVKLSGGLFQWASTVVRYVEGGSHDVRLEDIFSRPNQLGDLDALYTYILDTVLQTNNRTSTPTLLQYVLGSIVVAPTPISLATLAYLHADSQATLRRSTSEIKEILASLGSLLIVPTNSTEAIRVLHPSIIDFLTDNLRCVNPRIYIDRAAQNRRMALLCLHRMLRDLKRDICGVGDPTKFNADADVQELVSKHVSRSLRYACQYWAEHLAASGAAKGVEIEIPLQQFCAGHLIFWFEVMGLTGMVKQAVAAILMAEDWTKLYLPSSSTSTAKVLLHDAWRFLLMFSEPISANAAHIYLSALPTVPSGTEVGRKYSGSLATGLRILAGPMSKSWPGSFWVADRHTNWVVCLAFSPDSRTIVSGSSDWTLRLWDVQTGVQKGPTLEGHTDGVVCLAFSPDGSTVTSGSYDHTVRLWDVETGAQKGPALEGHTEPVQCLAFSPDGRTVASGSYDGTLRIWDVETGVQTGVQTGLTLDESVTCLAFSPDGTSIASGWDDYFQDLYTVLLWDVQAGVEKVPALEGHTYLITCLAFAPDGRTLASGSGDHSLRLWDVEIGAQKGATLEGHTERVSCLAFSPDGKTITSGSYDRTLRLWDVETGVQNGPTLTGHTKGVSCVAFLPDGMTVVSGSRDQTLRIWDVETGLQKGSALEGHITFINCVACSPDGTVVASGSDDHTLRLWDVQTGVQNEWTFGGHSCWVSCLKFSPDGGTLGSGSHDHTLRLWDVQTGMLKGQTLKGHTNLVTSLVFSLDGRTIASASGDHTLRLWDVETGSQKGPPFEGHIGRVSCLAFLHDGSTLASGSYDRTLRLWDVNTRVQKWPTLEGHTGRVSCLAVSPDGSTLISGSHDRTLRLWDVETGLQKRKALQITSAPRQLDFSVDGRITAVMADGEINVYQWDFATKDIRPFMTIPPDSRSTCKEVTIPVGHDGWVRYRNLRWFWLPAAFGRDAVGELHGDRFVFLHNRHVCIIDVSKIMYIIS